MKTGCNILSQHCLGPWSQNLKIEKEGIAESNSPPTLLLPDDLLVGDRSFGLIPVFAFSWIVMTRKWIQNRVVPFSSVCGR